MAHVLHPQQIYRHTLQSLGAAIRAIVRAVSSEHTLALRAAAKAASPRRSLVEVRSLYVPPDASQQGSGVDARSTKSA